MKREILKHYLYMLLCLIAVESLRFFFRMDALANEIQVASGGPMLYAGLHILHKLTHRRSHNE